MLLTPQITCWHCIDWLTYWLTGGTPITVTSVVHFQPVQWLGCSWGSDTDVQVVTLLSAATGLTNWLTDWLTVSPSCSQAGNRLVVNMSDYCWHWRWTATSLLPLVVGVDPAVDFVLLFCLKFDAMDLTKQQPGTKDFMTRWKISDIFLSTWHFNYWLYSKSVANYYICIHTCIPCSHN